jgi:N-acetylmuramoyl-L-alanine amidase
MSRGDGPDRMAVTWRASPNFGERRGGRPPWILLLHYTGMETGIGAEDWLCTPDSQVSAHYLVHEDGTIIQMVREADRAWHAGLSIWQGESDINSASIGIEIVNPGHAFGLPGYPAVQMAAVISLCRDICARNEIEPRHVLGHSDVSISRKIDPGERFPWADLWKAGVGHFAVASPDAPVATLTPGDTGREVEELQKSLGFYGYGLAATGVYDASTQACVAAFQRHFRPARIDGTADGETRTVLAQLVAGLSRRA